MGRRLFSTSAGVSMLLAAFLVVEWVHSHWRVGGGDLPFERYWGSYNGELFAGTYGGDQIAVPYWVLTLPALVLPVLWLLVRLSRRKTRGGHCRSCGYDLRGSPAAACPECGNQRTTHSAVKR